MEFYNELNTNLTGVEFLKKINNIHVARGKMILYTFFDHQSIEMKQVIVPLKDASCFEENLKDSRYSNCALSPCNVVSLVEFDTIHPVIVDDSYILKYEELKEELK